MFDSPMTNAFFTMIMGVGAIGVIFFVLKKYSKKISPKMGGNNEIQIISRSSLTPKSHLYIVEIENQKLVLGVTENSINLVKELDIDKKIELEEKNLDNIVIKDPKDISFKSFLKKAVLNK
ncbi:flagellar biosynthetic protein FliO [Candidatus Kapabacteria bacterium]|nr:flagellar biosynthetic protein FliO [Candidatus Kapabacteria bacterium]